MKMKFALPLAAACLLMLAGLTACSTESDTIKMAAPTSIAQALDADSEAEDGTTSVSADTAEDGSVITMNEEGTASAAASEETAAGDAADPGSETAAAGQSEASDETEGESLAAEKYVVVFDPGHGGKFPGATDGVIEEKDITLKVANYARTYLYEHYDNVEVYLTREEDIELDTDIKTDLDLRCQYAEDVGADLLVSIHFNASDSHKYYGAEAYYSRKASVTEQTKELAEDIMDELVALGINRREVTTRKSNDMFDENGAALDYYAINRHCAERDIPGIIVEQCFIDNENDSYYTSTEEGLQLLGEANARGVAKYLGLDDQTE